MSGDYVKRLRAFLGAHRPDAERKSGDIIATLPNPDGRGWRHLTGADLRAALDELERLRAVRTCGTTAVLFNDDEHVCVLPFGHGPEHRDLDGTRWQVYDAPSKSDDALKELLRVQGLTLPVSQRPEREAANAAQDGRSATETDATRSEAREPGSNSSASAAGLSGAEGDRDTSAWCWTPNPHTLLHCGLLKNHPMPHRRGERTWTDNETGDDHG